MGDQTTLRTIEKLGHELVEVRQRALLQLSTKLEHEFVSLKELNEYPVFAKRLMEWFNYPAPSNITLVLKLVSESIKIAPKHFINLGGHSFFEALSEDLDLEDKIYAGHILDEFEKHKSSFLKTVPPESSNFQAKNHMPHSVSNFGQNRPRTNKYPNWFKIATFPWKTLTLTDRQVLEQTSSSLCSRNIAVVVDYCTFLADVMFQDFPAQIFVQRPFILQTLIGFISTCSSQEYLSKSLNTLNIYIVILLDTLNNTKLRDITNIETTNYVKTTEDTECWEYNPVEILRQDEISLPVLAIELIESLSSIILLPNFDNLAQIRKAIINLSNLFHYCVEFDVLEQNLKDELTLYVIEKIRSVIEVFSALIIAYGRKTTASENDEDYKFYGIIIPLFENILPKIAPLDKLKLFAPASLEKALYNIAFDFCIPNSSLSLEKTSFLYLQCLNSDAGDAYINLCDIEKSLKATSKFYSENDCSKESVTFFIQNCFKTIKYHNNTVFIHIVIDYASKYSETEFLIRLLNEPEQTVRQNTLINLNKFLDDAITLISDSGNPSHSEKIEYLTCPDVLEKIMVLSHDPSSIISKNSIQIIHKLIVSGILWSEKINGQLKKVFETKLVFLELLVGQSEAVTNGILTYIFCAPTLEIVRLKSCLRLLLNKTRDVRTHVIKVTSDLVSSIFGKNIPNITDLFIVNSPIEQNEQRVLDQVFSTDSIDRLLKLIKSHDVEQNLKYSTYKQLAIIISDRKLAKLFLQNSGSKFLTAELKKLAEEQVLAPEDKEAAANICDTMRRLCHIRHELQVKLSSQFDFIVVLVKLVDQTAFKPSQHRSITSFLYMLIFTYPLIIEEQTGFFRCPQVIAQRLQLPFRVMPLEELSDTYAPFRKKNHILSHFAAQRTMRLSLGNTDKNEMTPSAQDIFYEKQMSLQNNIQEIENRCALADNHCSFKRGIAQANIFLATYPKFCENNFSVKSKFIKNLIRFFEKKPRHFKDEDLLICILEFSYNMLATTQSHSFDKFIRSQLYCVDCPLHDYIAFDTQLSRQGEQYSRTIVKYLFKIILKTITKNSYNNTIIIILKRMTYERISKNFRDLPFIQLITKALSKLTSNFDEQLILENTKNWFQLLKELVMVIVAFSRDESSFSESFMGKSVISNASISIMNIIRRVKKERWQACLLNEGSIKWLLYLVKFRTRTIRMSSFGILSYLLDTKDGFDLVENSFPLLYETLLKVIADDHESSIIRSLAFDCSNKSLCYANSRTDKPENSPMSLENLLHLLEKSNFFETMFHSLQNFNAESYLKNEPVVSVTPIFVKSFNEFILTLLRHSLNWTVENFELFDFPSILVQIINTTLTKFSDNVERKYFLQQAATTVQILTFLEKHTSNGYVFVLSLYSVEQEYIYELDIMLKLCNENVQKVFQAASNREDLENVINLTVSQIDNFSKKMIFYLAHEFWAKRYMVISFLQTLMVIASKLCRLKKNIFFHNQEKLLAILIMRFQEVARKPNSAVGNLRFLVGSCIQLLLVLESGTCETFSNENFFNFLTQELFLMYTKISNLKSKEFTQSSEKMTIIIFGIIQNMVFNNPNLVNLVKNNFVDVLEKLWSYCIGKEETRKPMFRLILNLTYKNQAACASLTHTKLVAQLLHQLHLVTTQITHKIKTDSSFRLVFSIANNLLILPEARALFWKENLLASFIKACDSGLPPGRSQLQGISMTLWINLLAGLSYYIDGQEQILLIPYILDYLSDVYENYEDDKTSVLLIQHNLCFHASSKIRISNHQRTIECLKEALSRNQLLRRQELSASASWALMSRSQKSKSRLKAFGFSERLETTINILADKNVSNEVFNAAYEFINF